MVALTVTAQREREWRGEYFFMVQWLIFSLHVLCILMYFCILLCCVYSVNCFLSNRFIFPTTRLGPESQFSDFLDGLGPAQIVGRQTLATPPMGES